MECNPQSQIEVSYSNVKVGFNLADIVINDRIIIEIKAAENLYEDYEAQLTNYLRATDIQVGLSFNFGKKPQIKKKGFSTEYNR